MWGRSKNGLIIMLMGELLQHLLIQHIRCLLAYLNGRTITQWWVACFKDWQINM
jgi:hypothetical protein